MSSPSATSSNAFTWVNESFPPEKCRKKENHDHETWLVKCFLQSHIIISITNPHRLPGHLRRAPFLTACTSSPPPPPCQQGRPWGGQSSPFVTLLSFSFCFIFLHTVFQLLIFWDNLGMVQEDLAISPGGLYESYFLYIIFGCKYCQIEEKKNTYYKHDAVTSSEKGSQIHTSRWLFVGVILINALWFYGCWTVFAKNSWLTDEHRGLNSPSPTQYIPRRMC